MTDAWPKWRPIETAPDDTYILCWGPTFEFMCELKKVGNQWWDGSNYLPLNEHPTHWLPLPPPPEGDAT